jgi:hypothetical protein
MGAVEEEDSDEDESENTRAKEEKIYTKQSWGQKVGLRG